MPIPLNTPRTSTPVVRRRRIDEVFVGAIVRIDQRDAKKIDGTPRHNTKGQPAKEVVVTCLAMPNTTMVAGLGGHDDIPAPGDEVRAIFTSGGLAQWIEALRGLGRAVNVGDILVMTTDHGIVYDVTGNKKKELHSQAAVDGYDLGRSENIGWRGEIKVRGPKTDQEAEWVARAEQVYHSANRIELADPPAAINTADLF